MDAAVLAQKMLEWRALKMELDKLEFEITEAVLEAGKTVVVGDVRARYRNPRKSYDYETPGSAAGDDVIQMYTTTETVTKTDWRAVCKAIGVSGIAHVSGEPTVKLILEAE